ncbi:MAG: hypothetical protein AAF756_04305 [Pseudomonadota bacterium]
MSRPAFRKRYVPAWLRHRIWMGLVFHKPTFYGLRLLNRFRRKDLSFAGRDTELVVEAYPRSANTFLVACIRNAMPGKAGGTKPLKLAHHVHSPLQFIVGLKAGAASILIVRDPLDAVASLMVRVKDLSAEHALGNYVDFHRRLEKHREQLLVLRFTDVINHPGAVMAHIQRTIPAWTQECSVEPSDISMEDVLATVDSMDSADQRQHGLNSDTVARPVASRSARSRALRRKIEETPEYRALISTAYAVYNDFLHHAFCVPEHEERECMVDEGYRMSEARAGQR